MPNALRVRAVPGRTLPAIDASGRPLPGRFVSYGPDGKPLAEVTVPSDSYHRRAVQRGDLELVTEPTPTTEQ